MFPFIFNVNLFNSCSKFLFVSSHYIVEENFIKCEFKSL